MKICIWTASKSKIYEQNLAASSESSVIGSETSNQATRFQFMEPQPKYNFKTSRKSGIALKRN